MWISSFVVTFDSEESARAVADSLAALPALELGPRQGLRLPVVVEAPDGSTSRYWHQWVEQLPGVLLVEVAFVSFDESNRGDDEAPRMVGA